ncbi:H/ACA ribonucleoprotein complex subunit 1 [Pancytospora philotis]|nr:H/ACA ribonucleoprotein complex subunit 1 [Pancytospora philotis]
MAMNYRDKRPVCTETVHMGAFLHACEDLAVLKLEHRNIPYPNSAVLQNGKIVGKVDEVFGPVDDVRVSVRLEGGRKVGDLQLADKFDGYKDKFMFKDRFLPREEVERQKEKIDKSKRPPQKGGFKGKGSFGDKGRGSFTDKRKPFNSGPGARGPAGDRPRNNFNAGPKGKFNGRDNAGPRPAKGGASPGKKDFRNKSE